MGNGYWGYYPADNDESWNLKDKIDEAINYQLDLIFMEPLAEEKNVPEFMMKTELRRRHKEETFNMWHRIGLVQLLLQTGVAIHTSHIAICNFYFKELEKDYKKFARGWRDGTAFERIFKKSKDAFEKLLNNNKGNDKILAPRGWLKRPWEKSGASWSGCVEAVEKDLQEEEKNG